MTEMKEPILLMRISAITHKGMIKPSNEDTIGVIGWVRNRSMYNPITIICTIDEPRLCLIADGVGGQAGGEVASSIVVEGLNQVSGDFKDENSIDRALSNINKQLYDTMHSIPNLRGMGSTIVGLAALGSRAYIFNCGDSRAYCKSGDFLRLLSIDDTSSFHQSDITAKTGIHSHSITQCLGGMPNFTEINPHIIPFSLHPGDRLLLCSDGLTDMLDQDQIEQLLCIDTASSIQCLFDAAMSGGGGDNISIIIADFELSAPALSQET
jgi:PPM family protein phosphatase